MKTTIAVDKTTREDLKTLGKKDEDYDEIIKRCINFTKRFENEHQFHEWFKENYNLFGFDEIVEENKTGSFPDFIMRRNNKEVRLELETLSSNFIIHKHNPKGVDLVICLVNDEELPVKTVEITPFEFPTKTTIQVSDSLRQKIKLFAAFRRTTIEKAVEYIVDKELGKMDLNAMFKELGEKKK